MTNEEGIAIAGDNTETAKNLRTGIGHAIWSGLIMDCKQVHWDLLEQLAPHADLIAADVADLMDDPKAGHLVKGFFMVADHHGYSPKAVRVGFAMIDRHLGNPLDDAARQRLRRAGMTSTERTHERDANTKRMRRVRASETPEQAEERRRKNRERMRAKRAKRKES